MTSAVTSAVFDQAEATNVDQAKPHTHMAGGSDPHQFDWKEVWYPVVYLRDLDTTQLTRVTLLEEDLVIWWDRLAQAWRVFKDQCPHRLVPLSQGRIAADGLLECPYHGWAFSGAGQCERIPQQLDQGKAEQSKRACVRSLPTAERQGLLFVYPGQHVDPGQVPVPVIEPLEVEPEGWICLDTFRDLPYDALTLLENVLDSSHIPFTHHQSVGNRANAAPVELEVIESNRQGFKGYWAEGPRRGSLGSQTTQFIAPALMWHDLTSKQFGRTMTVVYATPIRRGECRLFARFPFKFNAKLPAFLIRATPRWYSHIGNNGVLEDDQIFLHLQERYLAQTGDSMIAKAYYMPTRADSFVIEFRQWLTHFNADPFLGIDYPPTLSDTQLLDRYHSHTKHCKSCRQALTRIQIMKRLTLIFAILSWTCAPILAVTLPNSSLYVTAIALLALISGATSLGLGQLENQFYQGRAVPPRNKS